MSSILNLQSESKRDLYGRNVTCDNLIFDNPTNSNDVSMNALNASQSYTLVLPPAPTAQSNVALLVNSISGSQLQLGFSQFNSNGQLIFFDNSDNFNNLQLSNTQTYATASIETNFTLIPGKYVCTLSLSVFPSGGDRGSLYLGLSTISPNITSLDTVPIREYFVNNSTNNSQTVTMSTKFSVSQTTTLSNENLILARNGVSSNGGAGITSMLVKSADTSIVYLTTN
jgi:MinD-like ATPase involved in chromosome partitioning or flagellar assembly